MNCTCQEGRLHHARVLPRDQIRKKLQRSGFHLDLGLGHHCGQVHALEQLVGKAWEEAQRISREEPKRIPVIFHLVMNRMASEAGLRNLRP